MSPQIPTVYLATPDPRPKVAVCGLSEECTPSGTHSEFLVSRLEWDGTGFLDNYDISIIWVDGLANYRDLIIVREKQMRAALKKGKTVVLLFAEKTVAETDSALAPFRDVLKTFGLGSTADIRSGLRDIRSRQAAFETFLERHGLAFATFMPREQLSKDHIETDDIAVSNDRVVARAGMIGHGRVIMLPVHSAVMEQAKLSKQAIATLGAGVLRYLASVSASSHDWVTEGFVFDIEQPILEEEKRLSKQLEEVKARRSDYQRWKMLLAAKQYQLQQAVPVFLREILALDVRQEERFIEDFWIGDSEGNMVAIGEVTSIETGNVSYGTTGKIQSHRSQYGRADDFQGILIVNTFANRTSVTDKDQPIPPNVRKGCTNSSVLITRTLDLVRIYNLMLAGKVTQEAVKNLVLTGSGWLTIDERGVLCLVGE